MTAEQEAAFWQTIDAFDEMKLLRHVMIVGSWAEYIFNRVFKSGFIANLKTRDVDFFYANVNRPAEKIPLAETLKKIGFLYDEVDGISKFYKGDLLELEFISRVLGSGNDTRVKIKPLGITSEALRDVNIFAKFPLEVKIASPGKKNYTITVPEPSAYAVQKILANPSRVPAEKKLKDMISVKEILYHIEKSAEQTDKLFEVASSLTKKQRTILKSVCSENEISAFEKFGL